MVLVLLRRRHDAGIFVCENCGVIRRGDFRPLTSLTSHLPPPPEGSVSIDHHRLSERSRAAGVLGDLVGEGLPQRGGEVVAHAGDDVELGAGDGAGDRFAARRGDDGIGGAVED